MAGFSKKKIKRLLNTKCVFWLSAQILSDTFLILRRTERDVIINVYWASCTVPFFGATWILSTVFRNVLKYQTLWKSVLWKPGCSMRTDRRVDRRTDMTKLIVSFHNFANSLRNYKTVEFTSCHWHISLHTYSQRPHKFSPTDWVFLSAKTWFLTRKALKVFGVTSVLPVLI
jgi:hypothetical protein